MLLQKAKKLAREKHAGQLRKDGKTPYFEHPAAVVDILGRIGVTDEDILCAAWLHDVVEDCDVSISEIRNHFNDRIADMVFVLTRNVDREAYNKRLLDSTREIQLIKLADMAHNCRTLQCLDEEGIKRKVTECREIFLPMAREMAPELYQEIKGNIEKISGEWQDS